jgi:ribokinase
MVVKAHHLPAPGETIIGGKYLMNPGGKGANQAVAAVRLGGIVSFITKTGNDIFGRQARQVLEDEGLDVSGILEDPAHPSGVALITVDGHGENCIVVAPGSNMELNTEDIDKATSIIENSDIILMQLEIPVKTVDYVKKMVEGKNKLVIVNPAPATQLPDKLLSGLYILTPNESEAEILTGITITDKRSLADAGLVLQTKGVKNVIITLGATGAFLLNESYCDIIDGFKVDAVDTTAAGDTFNGALAVALSEGKEIVKAIKFANKAASITVTKMGAQSSIPFRKELY